MKIEDFATIKHFKPAEITATGANIADIQKELIVAYDKFRELIGRPIHLIKDGITTGNHKAPEHGEGKAGDCWIDGAELPDPLVLACAIKAGFRGIGIYWNQKQKSYHLDLRADYTFWNAKKSVPRNAFEKTVWIYGKLLQDPKLLLI
jgi:hypothetical protein